MLGVGRKINQGSMQVLTNMLKAVDIKELHLTTNTRRFPLKCETKSRWRLEHKRNCTKEPEDDCNSWTIGSITFLTACVPPVSVLCLV